MKVCISSGHGKYVRGASGYPVPPQLDEVNEARRVTESTAAHLRERGVEALTFHDDTSKDQSTNLATITNWHNAQGSHDLDVSVHFNAYDGSAHGTEVLYVTQEELADDLSEEIADAGGFTNRGPKYRSDLYVLNNTREPCVLLEVCFCDNTSDSNKYHEHFEEICAAIAETIAPGEIEEVPEPPLADVDIFPDNQRGITCTMFGGVNDPNQSAYDEHWISDQELGCALPFKWKTKKRPQVLVVNTANHRRVTTQIVDVGPWNTNDPYWQTNTRPQAESGVDNSGRETNLAGIDLTPGAAKAIGLDGMGLVNWRFVEEPEGMV